MHRIICQIAESKLLTALVRTRVALTSLGLSVLILVGCTANSYDNTVSTTGCTASVSSMLFTNNETLCKWYWNDLMPGCDGMIANELKSRNVSVARATCGEPNATVNSQLQATPPSTASMNRSPPAASGTSCTYNTSVLTNTDLCRWYWGNLMPTCNGNISNELKSRNVNVAPQATCGQAVTPVNMQPQVRAPTPVSPRNTCDLGEIQVFSSQPASALCAVAYNKGSCSQLARLALQGQGLQVGSSAGTCGAPSRNECSTLLERSRSLPDPISATCAVRNDKSSLSGLRCRSDIAGFLLGFSKSSGLNGNQCGQPLTAQELAIHKK
jgi:hypothetical protein